MSTRTRITRSKGESDRLSLPMRMRPTRKETILGRDGGTVLSTFNAGWDQQQQMLTQMSQLPTQSPQANPVGRNQPNRTFAHNPTTERPTSTRTTADYTTQGDPNISPSTPNLFRSTATDIEFLGTNNFFVPDGSNRHIHQIDNKVFHAGYLENGNNAYLLELPALEKMLNTWKFLMDEMSGRFYVVYGNSYQ